MLYFDTSFTERRKYMKKTGLQGYRKNFIKLLSVFMVLFPWITYLKLELYNEAEKSIFYSYDGVRIDFFVYHKEIMLILVAILALLWFVGERFLPQKVDNNVPLFKGQNKWLFIMMGVFAVGAVVSTVFSKYSHNALWGSPTVGEGLWTLLAYVVLMMAFYNYFANEYAMSMLKNVMTALSGITVVLTLVEWFYKPLLNIGLVQALVAPSKYADVVSSMEADVFTSAISLTFYNPGYFGGFVCILLPFVLIYCLQEKKLVGRILYGVLFAGLLFGVVASNTTTALYIAILEVVLVVAAQVIPLLKKQEMQKVVVLQSGAMLALAVVVLLLAGVITGNSFLNVFSNANSATGNVVEERFEIEDIQMQDNRVVLLGEETELVIAYENARLCFYDKAGKEIVPMYEGSDMTFSDSALSNLKVSVRSASEKMQDVQLCVLVDAGYQSTIDFFVMKTGEFAGIGQGLIPLKDIGDAGTPDALKSLYGMFTGRGYAWVNSLPVLKDTLVVGKGPGNFAYYFKQFDYAGLLPTHGNVRQVIDKPHNAYIQYAINVGLPAAIAFFGIFVMAIYRAVKVFLKDKGQKLLAEQSAFHVAGVVSLIGFLLYSIINDSMVTVTPVMCMITGALLASCYMVEEKK